MDGARRWLRDLRDRRRAVRDRPARPGRLLGVLDRLRRPGTPRWGWTARLTVAAVASYVAADLALAGPVAPLTAPLTALLVVQLTPVSLLVSGLDRVVSVVAGVGLAVLVSSATGLTWWSLGLVVAVSAVIGQVLRLGSNLLEVPISAMLVLGVGAATGAAAGQRIAETLIGAGIGVLSNLLFPPQVVVPDAAAAISGVADDLARLLDEAADGLEGDDAQGQELAARSARWLDRARVITHHMPETGAALLRAEESRRLNLRALRRPDAGPGLRQGLEAVEHSSVAIRMMFATLESVARRRADEERPVPAELREAFAVVLRDIAAGLARFGRLVRSEAYAALPPSSVRSEAYAALPPVVRTAVRPPLATARAVPAPDPEPVRDALEDLHEARARLIDLLMVDPWEDPGTSELVAVLASTVERLLRELDLEGRDRRRRALTRPSARPASRRPAARTSRAAENG